MTDSRTFLKVKIKSLAAEAKIIRHEEQKQRGQLRTYLHAHRVWTVRRAARATHLAYAYIRGRSYKETENKAGAIDPLILNDVVRMAFRYGKFPARMWAMTTAENKELHEKLAAWIKAE